MGILNRILAAGVSGALLTTCTAGSSELSEQGLTFYAPFERDAVAVRAGGNPEPTENSIPGELVQGIKGKGIKLTPETLLSYAVPGNYHSGTGTLSFCFKILKPEQEKNECALFCEDGSLKGYNYIRIPLLSDTAFFNRVIWQTWGEGFRYTRGGRICKKPVGEWHHILLTWDRSTVTHFYLDGELKATGSRKEKAKFGRFTDRHVRQPAEFESITFGSRALSDFMPRAGNDTEMVIDEIRIYDRLFSDEEAKSVYQNYFPLQFNIDARSFECGNRETITMRLRNATDKERTFKATYEVADASGRRILQTGRNVELSLAPGEEAAVPAEPVFSEPGDYVFRIKASFDDYRPARNFWICAYPPQKKQPAAYEPELDLRLIKAIDCTEDYGPDEFCDDGMSRVIDTDLGKYRITSSNEPFSRFAYRFFVDRPETPHLAVIEYPDDHEYEMEVMIDNRGNGIVQTVENGVIVGGHYPNLHRFNAYKLLFWPTSEETTIMFMNWRIRGAEDRLGAAAARSIRIYEVTGGLPAMAMKNLPPATERRTVGYQEENGTITYEFSGNLVHGNNRFRHVYPMLYRRMRYMKHVGQNLMVMPALQYSGSMYPSEEVGPSGKRRYYPPYFSELLLDMAEAYGVKVHGNMLFLTNDALERQGADVSDEDMIAGKEHIYNIKWNGNISNHGAIFSGGPAYNVFHPDVQAVILDVLDEYLGLYGDHPAFDGLNFWFWPTCPLWAGGLRCGYSDYTIKRFETETEVKVPGEAPNPARFTERYVFLARTDEKIRRQWVDWRCKNVKAFWMAIVDRVRAKNPDATVTLDDWTIFVEAMSSPNYTTEAWKPGDLDSVKRYHRYAGLNLDIFDDVPGFLLGQVVKPNDNPPRERYIGRDMLWAPAYVRAFQNEGKTAVWLEQRRREFDNMAGATSMPDYWLPEGSGHPHKRRDGSSQARPGGGWLQKSGAIMPNADYYLEFYAKVLADFDVREITDGGITLTTLGAEDVLRDFIRAYRTLPTEYFAVFKDVNDPVCVRHCGNRFYAVNREFYPVNVTVNLTGDTTGAGVTDLVDDRKLPVRNGAVAFEIGRFRVRSFKLPEGVHLDSVNMGIPAERRSWLKGRYDALWAAYDRMQEENTHLPPNVSKDVPWFAQSLKQAWEAKHYSRVRKLLDSNWSQYIHDFAAGPEGPLQSFLKHLDYGEKYFSRPLQEYAAEKVDKVPGISSSQWRRFPSITDFSSVYLFRAGKRFFAKPPEQNTEVHVCYDKEAIGFLFKCYEPHMEKVVAEHKRKLSDLVKIMLNPGKEAFPYYYFRIRYDNAGFYNARLDWEEKDVRYDTTFKKKLEYDADFRKGEGYWLGRFVIPFHTLGRDKAPDSGAVWRFNLARRIRTKGLDALRCRKDFLPPKPTRFHDPRTYDYLVFK